MARRSAGSGGSTHRHEVAPELTASYDSSALASQPLLLLVDVVAQSLLLDAGENGAATAAASGACHRDRLQATELVPASGTGKFRPVNIS